MQKLRLLPLLKVLLLSLCVAATHAFWPLAPARPGAALFSPAPAAAEEAKGIWPFRSKKTSPRAERIENLPRQGNAGGESKSKFLGALTDNPVSRAVGSAIDRGTELVKPKKKSRTAQRRLDPPDDPLSLSHESPPPGPELYVSIARASEQSGNDAMAVQQYKRALEVEPDFAEALLGYARLRDRQGQLKEATTLYLEAATRHPELAAAHNDLGLCYARRGMLDESIDSLSHVVTLQPTKHLYRNNLATVLAEVGRTDEALMHLSAVNPKSVAHYNLGYMLAERGQTREAADQFYAALTIDPELKPAAVWLAKLGIDPRKRPAGSAQHSRPDNVPENVPDNPPAGIAERPHRRADTQTAARAEKPPTASPAHLPAVAPAQVRADVQAHAAVESRVRSQENPATRRPAQPARQALKSRYRFASDKTERTADSDRLPSTLHGSPASSGNADSFSDPSLDDARMISVLTTSHRQPAPQAPAVLRPVDQPASLSDLSIVNPAETPQQSEREAGLRPPTPDVMPR